MNKTVKTVLVVVTGFIFMLLYSCSVSFQGVSISQDVKNFYVAQFETKTFSAPPSLAFDFSEALKDKILRDSRLEYEEVDPHVSFEGTVTKYRTVSISPQAGGAELNRLEIGMRVKFENVIDDDTWEQNIEFFSDFDRDVNLQDIEQELIDDIFDQLLEDIFNRAFANW